MFYVTGDKHGNYNDVLDFCCQNDTTQNDVLVILGDAGINFCQDARDKKLKELLATLPITLFCIHGNHDMRPQNIASYKEVSWNAGVVFMEEEYPNILFAKDGEVYNFDGKSVLVIGGAYSVDKKYRLFKNLPWFEDEQPSEEVKAKVLEKLKQVDWSVDIILTHTMPYNCESQLFLSANIDQTTVDKSTEHWLDYIMSNTRFSLWYGGHFHFDSEIRENMFVMFNGYRELISTDAIDVVGVPLYRVSDCVSFMYKNKKLQGLIYNVRPYGFGDYAKPMYSISVGDVNYKRIPQDQILSLLYKC